MDSILFKKALEVFSSGDYGAAWRKMEAKPTSTEMPKSIPPEKVKEILREMKSVPMPKSAPTKPKFDLNPHRDEAASIEDLNLEMEELLNENVKE
jgi:hypothetical protein